jgi:hypothetical protein
VLEKDQAADACTFGVADVDVVATIVLHNIADLVAACGVWCPGLLNFRENMSFNLASEWCKWVAVIIVLSIEISISQDGFKHSCRAQHIECVLHLNE